MILTEATQWFRNGDHPQDESTPLPNRPDGSARLSEGKVVKYFKSLTVAGGRFCSECGNIMQKHGVLEGLNGEEIVCPGDYIITRRDGSLYRMSAAEFEAMYEPTVPTRMSS